MSCGIKIKSIKKVKTEPIPVFDISVDKNHNFILKDGSVVHNCKPYQYLRSTIYEERIEMYDSILLTEELIGLERDNNNGKIDHSQAGINSKDTADAICGAIWNASQNAEQFAFDYGENIESILETNTQNSTIEQFNLDFEEELKKVFNPQHNNIQNKNQEKSPFMDFGLGAATNNYNSNYLANGIVVW